MTDFDLRVLDAIVYKLDCIEFSVELLDSDDHALGVIMKKSAEVRDLVDLLRLGRPE